MNHFTARVPENSPGAIIVVLFSCLCLLSFNSLLGRCLTRCNFLGRIRLSQAGNRRHMGHGNGGHRDRWHRDAGEARWQPARHFASDIREHSTCCFRGTAKLKVKKSFFYRYRAKMERIKNCSIFHLGKFIRFYDQQTAAKIASLLRLAFSHIFFLGLLIYWCRKLYTFIGLFFRLRFFPIQ